MRKRRHTGAYRRRVAPLTAVCACRRRGAIHRKPEISDLSMNHTNPVAHAYFATRPDVSNAAGIEVTFPLAGAVRTGQYAGHQNN